MAKRKSHNPERRAWRGRSYKKHGERIVELKAKVMKTEDKTKTKKTPYYVRDGFEAVEGLYAFWSYDLYPFCCGGTVMSMDAEGRAQIIEYQGGIVRPIKVLPLEAGKKLHDKIKQVDRLHDETKKAFDQEWSERIALLLPEARK